MLSKCALPFDNPQKVSHKQTFRRRLQQIIVVSLIVAMAFPVLSALSPVANAATVDSLALDMSAEASDADAIKTVLSLSDVPVEIMRRATDFLEEWRGSDQAPNWENARFAEDVRALYRPDISGIAYYELPIEIPDGDDGYTNTGFIQLSNGEHDYPITHWDFVGNSPTQDLDTLAADESGFNTQYFKLDNLSYASEYSAPQPTGDIEATETVLTIGTLPSKIVGFQALPLNGEFELTSVEYTPSQDTTDDSEIITDTQIAVLSDPVVTGPRTTEDFTQEDWETWDNLKEGYSDSYGTMLSVLSDSASPQWDAMGSAEEYGDALIMGESRTIRAVQGRTLSSISVTGEGADAAYIEQEQLTESDMPEGVRFTVIGEPTSMNTALPVNINIAYTDNVIETRKFVIINSLSIASNRVLLPFTAKSADNSVVAASIHAPKAISGSWSSWRFWDAGSDADQRLYRQMSANSSPNTSGCASGCGGTAWSMLIGWADNQASLGNPRWSGRWGLYRQNGGRGSNAVAPRQMDSGVRTMTWEIRNDIDTWCAFGQGATFPWDMDEVSGYLSGRTGATASTHYNVLGIHEDRLRDRAINSIKNGTPVIIGTGWLKHYPLAYKYKERSRRTRACAVCWWKKTEYQRSFYVNQGWGGSSNGWVNAGTWFTGELKPN